MQQIAIYFVANFEVEKKVPNSFIDWNANVSKTKHALMQKMKWLFDF